MRNYILFLSTFFTIAFASGQSFNHLIDASGEQPLLLGKINKEGLSKGAFASWFLTNYDSYVPKEEITNQLKNELSGYTITAFMGTWCGDSKREVPKFYKVLEQANFPLDRLTMVAVARNSENYKKSPGGEEEGLNIHSVPTFIFYKDGKEVNRIVESPKTTIEEDILQLLQGNYEPNYPAVTMVHDALQEMGFKNFRRDLKK